VLPSLESSFPEFLGLLTLRPNIQKHKTQYQCKNKDQHPKTRSPVPLFPLSECGLSENELLGGMSTSPLYVSYTTPHHSPLAAISLFSPPSPFFDLFLLRVFRVWVMSRFLCGDADPRFGLGRRRKGSDSTIFSPYGRSPGILERFRFSGPLSSRVSSPMRREGYLSRSLESSATPAIPLRSDRVACAANDGPFFPSGVLPRGVCRWIFASARTVSSSCGKVQRITLLLFHSLLSPVCRTGHWMSHPDFSSTHFVSSWSIPRPPFFFSFPSL